MRTATLPAVSVRERNGSVPPAIDELILGLLEKDPKKRRPESARELAGLLEAFAEKNGWKWVVPPILARDQSGGVDSETPTAAVPAPSKLE
jgi:hypothetical protein